MRLGRINHSSNPTSTTTPTPTHLKVGWDFVITKVPPHPRKTQTTWKNRKDQYLEKLFKVQNYPKIPLHQDWKKENIL